MKITLIRKPSINQKKKKKQVVAKRANCWLCRLIFRSGRGCSPLVYATLPLVICLCLCLANLASAGETADMPQDGSLTTGQQQSSPASTFEESLKSIPANHRMDQHEDAERAPLKQTKTTATAAGATGGRQGRQYDGSIGASSTGNYASISGDGAAYVAQVPLTGSNYGALPSSSSASNYASDLSGAYHSAAAAMGSYHDPLSMARGYPASSVGPMHHPGGVGYPGGPMGGGPLSSIFSGPMGGGGAGLLSSSMFPLMSKGFDVSEIVCTAVALAVGAVIVGAPFVLLYLFVMNQMNGNGPNMGPSGGAISLTGPTSSTTVSGRKKRHTSLPEVLFKQLSPLVNSEQVANTFKALMGSIAKYQM